MRRADPHAPSVDAAPGSRRVEMDRETGIRRHCGTAARVQGIKELGKAALPDLERAVKDVDCEISSRAISLIKCVEIREQLEPALFLKFPDLDERLASGGPPAYPQAFMIAARQLQAVPPPARGETPDRDRVRKYQASTFGKPHGEPVERPFHVARLPSSGARAYFRLGPPSREPARNSISPATSSSGSASISPTGMIESDDAFIISTSFRWMTRLFPSTS